MNEQGHQPLGDEEDMNAAVLAEIRTISAKLDSLTHELKGNGQKGFIAETREHIADVRTWQAIRSAQAQESDNRINRRFTLWGLFIGGSTIAFDALFHFWKGK